MPFLTSEQRIAQKPKGHFLVNISDIPHSRAAFLTSDFPLENGRILEHATVCYETWGREQAMPRPAALTDRTAGGNISSDREKRWIPQNISQSVRMCWEAVRERPDLRVLTERRENRTAWIFLQSRSGIWSGARKGLSITSVSGNSLR